MWATQRSNEAKLNEAFDSVENVILIFSVNRTQNFQVDFRSCRLDSGSLCVCELASVLLKELYFMIQSFSFHFIGDAVN